MRAVVGAFALASLLFSNVLILNAAAGNAERNLTGTELTLDLTQLGRQGSLREDLSIEREALELINALVGKSGRQILLVDELNIAQRPVVEQLAIRIAKGSVPASLKGKTVIMLDEANLFSNARSQAELAQRFTAVIEDAAAQEGEAILFINNIKGFIQEASLSNVLWEAIAEGDVRLIAGSSASVYGELSASYPELNKAF
ncbi:MAG TPA: hypothetical protein PKE66_13040, partial [Pyrinomonadaceae bacterium]|nr:hypothetical protein [Pyrinomonadaceae bacterium]